jgi:hypothetical protein
LQGIEVTGAEFKRVPGQAQLADHMGTVLGRAAGSTPQKHGTVTVARGVTRLRHQFGQHVELADIELAQADGFFHQARAAVKVELERARHGLFKRNGPVNGIDAALGHDAVGRILHPHLLRRDRMRLYRCAGNETHQHDAPERSL